ncbi:hypothetical protein FSP39_014218 [Pinctada imbricata]|uniref:Phosphodiesterase n=1 Tax=Pinctada imbricata TaxID=66713 RepID=A0AA88YE85_PINIB|nr:hypothetical protein FSP39_014218 [Pinctada imbricata]
MASNLQRLSNLRRTPIPGPRGQIRDKGQGSSISESEVRALLINNPSVFDSFVLECVAQDRLERLLQAKKDKPIISGIPEPCFPLQIAYKGESVKNITQTLVINTDLTDRLRRLSEVADVLATSLDANGVTIYIPRNSAQELSIYRNGLETPCGPAGLKMTVAAHAAFERKSLIINDVKMDNRFPKGISPNILSDCRVMCVPIEFPSGEMFAIVEFTRDHFKTSFKQCDLQMANLAFSWMSGCMYQSELKNTLTHQQGLNNFLLETTKDLFDEMTCLDTVVQKVIMFTKDLVKAERCNLFLMDDDRNELYTDHFDVGPSLEKKPSQMRFPAAKGIEGYVAKTGEAVSIPNAYEDSRFNPDIDDKYGFKTRNILCMPIVNKGRTIGVVEMVNSTRGEHFTQSDQLAFHTFAAYSALALSFSRVYSMLNQQQNQYKVAMEVLQYHIVCTEDEIKHLQDNPFIHVNDLPSLFSSFDFCVYDFLELIPKLFIHMIQEMFGPNQFEIEKLCGFILTVKKNYRPVTYHNFEHGFHVSHSLWYMLSIAPDLFTTFEKMALVISGICHDIDHRGYNNAFFTKLSHPLAALYSTSVMEQHHYKQTVTILHTEGIDIFSFLDHDSYKQILELIRHHILATDLALYFGNQKSISSALDGGTYDITDDTYRLQTKAIMMSAADLCATCKPWETQDATVEKLYDEFYMQGDEEKKRGLVPLPMMDRATVKDQPKQQIGFIDFICVPLYTTLARIIPETEPLLVACKENKKAWVELAHTQT